MSTVYNDRTAIQLVDDVAEAIRGLNHVTMHQGSLQYPSEAYAVLGGLTQMLQRLPQALQQIDGLVGRWVDDGQVVMEAGEFVGDPEAAAAAVSIYLSEARAAADECARAVGRAQATLSNAALADANPD